MCLICVDYQRGVLKISEAKRALFEMRAALDPKHAEEVEQAIAEAEAKEAAAGTPSSGPPSTLPGGSPPKTP